MRNLLLLSCFLLCGSALNAQTSTPAKSDGQQAPKVDSTKVSYDRFEDKTTVTVEVKPARVALPDGSGELFRLPISVRFECPGQSTRCNPTSILLSHEGGSGLAYCNDTPIVFVADGERVRAKDCIRVGGVVVVFQMAPDAFVCIAEASRVELKIGEYVWTFNDASLDAIRSLAAHVDLGPAASARPQVR